MKEKSEQLFCKSSAPIVWSDFHDERKRVIFKTRCKQWSCEYCARINYYKHWLRTVKGIENLEDKGYDFDFVTLTSHERVATTLGTYNVWKSAWKKLSTRYRRAYSETYGLSCAYVYVPELHKDGRLHIHGLFSGHITTRWWKDNARECGLGYQCKSIVMADRSKGANYTLKYVTKALSQDINIKRFRRINYSRNIPPLPKNESDNVWGVSFKANAITSLIENAWLMDYDAEFQGRVISEIVEDY